MNESDLRNVPIESITVGDRFRTDLGNMAELVLSIKDKGIIQPISLSPDLKLVAGFRRLMAAKLAGLDSVPAIIRHEAVDELDAREIELFENIHRKDMVWVERNELYTRIHEIWESKNKGKPYGWSETDTADGLSVGYSSLKRSIQLAKAVRILPELGECLTEDEAFKKLKKIQEKIAIAELRAQPNANLSSTDVVDRRTFAESHYRIGDALEEMAELLQIFSERDTSSNINFIECDPPYAVDLLELKTGEDSSRKEYREIEAKDYPLFLKKLASLTYDLASDNCWMVFWFGTQWHTDVKVALSSAGWDVHNIPCIWTKGYGQNRSPETNLSSSYETFFYCRKGNIQLAKQGRINVFDFPTIAAPKKYHPTQKPLELMDEILDTFSYPGGLVMIPFLGSGVTLRSAYRKKMNGFGWDLSEEYKGYFVKSLVEDTEV